VVLPAVSSTATVDGRTVIDPLTGEAAPVQVPPTV